MIRVKYVLSCALSLLYRESQLGDVNINSKDWIRDIIVQHIQIQDGSLTIDHENRILFNLKEMVIRMTRDHADKRYDYQSLFQELKITCEHDQILFETITGSIYSEMGKDDLIKFIRETRAKIEEELKKETLRETLKKAAAKVLYQSDSITSMTDFVGDVINELMPYQSDATVEDNKHILSRVRITDLESVGTALDRVAGESSGKLVIRTPWKAINRMLAGGLRRAQTAVVGALKHNYKTGFCVDLAIGTCLFNDPKDLMVDPEKKPLVLYISAEDEDFKILGTIYQRLVENYENVEVDANALANLNVSYASNYIHDKLTSRGYDFQLIKVNPSECTYRDIIDIVQSVELEGYEIHLCVVDYLNMLSKRGCRQGVVGEDVQDLFNKMRGFFSAKNIAFVTPHQLSSDAENEGVRSGRAADLVNIVSSGSYFAGARGIGREVDLELYCHKVEESGEFYMTFRRGKHRVVAQTPAKHLYTILPFSPIGGLRFDVDQEYDTSVSRIGAKRSNNGDEIMPFWNES